MIHSTSFEAFDSQIMAAVDSDHQPAILEEIPAWFEEWEFALSRFRFDSELSVVNQRSGEAVHVSPAFASVFEVARNTYQASDTFVTPLVLDALIQAGYDRSFAHIPSQSAAQTVDGIHPSAPIDQIQWDPTSHVLTTPPGFHLDFGGVAKGWAASQAQQRLSKVGPALVDAGGDISISGPRENGNPWLIGIANPFFPDENIELIEVEQGGVATSGIDKRRWYQDNAIQHHIIDPRMGTPALTDVFTATVVAPTTIEAEMAAKVVLILGSQDGLQWLQEKYPQLAVLLVLENGTSITNRNMESYIWRHDAIENFR